ncbi:MAG: SPOR domain-containing protein [Deltaproteobacteria bacterium]|nr:SPOR domain-containing protein [Deltaproteobacteria bacterium]
MIHFLRHAAARLWITLLIGTTASLWAFPLLPPHIGLEAAPVLAAILLAALFFAVGWAANRLGLAWVRRWVRSAGRAERDGLHVEAEAAFRRALSMLDSFLVSPAVRRRNLAPLTARLARFYLARPRGGAEIEELIAGYLAAHPDDEEVAEQWVLRVEPRGELREDYQVLATRLGAVHPRNGAIQSVLARLYLMLERTDYPALQCYRRVCEAAAEMPPEFCRDLTRLLRRDGRTDAWVQQFYRRPIGPLPAAPEAPASAAPTPGTGPGRAVYEAPAEAAPAAAADGAFRMSVMIDEVQDEEGEAHPSAWVRPRRWPPVWKRLARLRGEIAVVAAHGAHRMFQESAAALRAVLRPPAMLYVLGAVIAAGAAAGGIWLFVNAGDGFFRPAAIPAAAEPAVVRDPYTLQVAAYLKSEYAVKFVDDLKQRGYDAYRIETASGGKTWYQVRIAHFPDPQSARDFGARLKQKGIIEDFYVTNYTR